MAEEPDQPPSGTSASLRSAAITAGGRTRTAAVLGALFTTGACALILQITWQRIIALHSGVDLSSSTTVVAVVLAGLGIGNLLGGRVADRVGPRDALGVLGASCIGVGLYAVASPWLLYDLYRTMVGSLAHPLASFAFNASVLVVPTVLLGATLPLAATATTSSVTDAGRQVGRLQAANTFGAGIGAFVGGWYLVGSFGLDGTTRLVAVVELAVGGTLLALRRTIPGTERQVAPERTPPGAPEPVTASAAERGRRWPTGVWYAVYGVSGAVALGFEQVFFRLVDGALRSNAYTFGHVLGIYLVLWSLGAAAGSVLVRRAGDLRRWLMWTLFAAGAGALAALVLAVQVIPDVVLVERFSRWFDSSGLASGLAEADLVDRVLFGIAAPVWVMAVPVVLLGASFPFAQALVTTDLDRVGRATGRLQFANLAGNVAGTLIASFVLIDRLGTAGAYLLLAAPALLAGLVAASLAPSRPRALLSGVGVVAIALLLATSAPTNAELWARLHATTPDGMLLAEDRSCASAVELYGTTDRQLTINGAAQNNYPFDEFHILIGLIPALASDGGAGLAIGYGIGSTSYAMLASDRLDPVTSVELCGGNYRLTEQLARTGAAELRRLHSDPRHRMVVGDGRRHLLVHDRDYAVIVPDTVRPSSAGSNNVYSREFFELVDDRLEDDGVVASWVATNRVLNAATSVFPYVARLEVGEYNGSSFLLASRSPLMLDPEELTRRFDLLPADAFPDEIRASLRDYLTSLAPECLNDGVVAPEPRADAQNRDLRPRDEYFLNQGGTGEDGVSRTC